LVSNRTLEVSQRDRDLFIASIESLCAGKHRPFDRVTAQAFYDQFREGNERLKEQVFPGRDRPLFSENFSDYPETVDDNALSAEDVSRLVFELWQLGRRQGAASGTMSKWLMRLGLLR